LPHRRRAGAGARHEGSPLHGEALLPAARLIRAQGGAARAVPPLQPCAALAPGQNQRLGRRYETDATASSCVNWGAPWARRSLNRSAGIGRANRYPWPRSQPKLCSDVSCPRDSIPSATATRPSAWARLTRLAVIAASLASCIAP